MPHATKFNHEAFAKMRQEELSQGGFIVLGLSSKEWWDLGMYDVAVKALTGDSDAIRQLSEVIRDKMLYDKS